MPKGIVSSRVDGDDSVKRCFSCKQVFPIEHFYKNRIGWQCPECCRESNRQSVRNLKKEVISQYGGRCECCGETLMEFLSLDHRNGGGRKKRLSGEHPSGQALYRMLKKMGFPQEEFRVLCHNCNQSLGVYGYCPHQGGSSEFV